MAIFRQFLETLLVGFELALQQDSASMVGDPKK
jgi:hypothetical protein